MKYPTPALPHSCTALPEDFPTTHQLVQGDARSLSFIADESIHLVEQVLNNEVNPEIVKSLEEYGCKARGIHGEHIGKLPRQPSWR